MTTGTTGALAALSPSQLDRAEGVLLVQACGDALGVPWELGHSPTDSGCGAEASEGFMQGGGLGPYAPGEWSDDTQMSVIVARVAATGAYLTSRPAGRHRGRLHRLVRLDGLRHRHSDARDPESRRPSPR